MTDEQKKIIVISGCILFISIMGIIAYMYPVWKTEVELKKAAFVADKHDHQTGSTDYYDYWDNRILLIRENIKEENYIKYTAYSAGRDQEYNTDDDIEFFIINVNWSKSAGSAAGEMATEAWKGFKETFKKESRHDK